MHYVVSGHFRDWMLAQKDGNIAKFATQSKESSHGETCAHFLFQSNRSGGRKPKHPAEIIVESFILKILHVLEDEKVIVIDDLVNLLKVEPDTDLFEYVTSKLV